MVSCSVDKWKVDVWALKLRCLTTANEELTTAHGKMTDRVLALEEELAAAQAREEGSTLQQRMVDLPRDEQLRCGLESTMWVRFVAKQQHARTAKNV